MKKTFLLTAIISLILTIQHVIAENNAIVIAYCPAPGQFVNELPKIENPVDSVTSAATANEKISKGMMVSLGGFGGYLIVKFDSPVSNGEGYDFVVLGNAFEKSAEPGIVMVSEDKNNNGIPDDPWYEIAGSEYAKSTLNYEITYYKPTAEHDASTSDVKEYIRWTDNQGGTGWIGKNTFHTQSYYPMWASDHESITFTGTLLPENIEEVDGVYNLLPYPWGYADNQKNSDEEKCGIDIDWAVDADGNKADINRIDFVRIHTGVNAARPLIGELSTEVSKIYERTRITAVNSVDCDGILFADNILKFSTPTTESGYIYDINGRKMENIAAGVQQISLAHLPQGIYIYRSADAVFKFVISHSK